MWTLTKSGDPNFKFVADGFIPVTAKGIEELDLLAIFRTKNNLEVGISAYFFNRKEFWLTTPIKSVQRTGENSYTFTTRNSEYNVTKETI